ncbi:MAG: cobalamin-binding protein [Candidatus Rokubacteria bacterium]|nr:cobalamin-binding protein [Candidatus Rokubacteria bacterium]
MIDASGVALELVRPPRRIVSLIPSTTEMLCELGLADAIVGITAYCIEPRDVVRTKPKVGGEKNPDLDAIRALAPDLVIANLEENVRDHVETLRAWNVPVWVTYPRTVLETIAFIREIGTVTGTEARAGALADEIEALYHATRAAMAGPPPVPVFYPIWRDPYMTIGRDTYVHDVLATVGASNVFGDRERYPTITLEEMAVRSPDVIILPDEPFRFRRAHVKDFEAFPQVPAVRAGRIHLMDGKIFCWHGPRLAEALRTLPRLFRPDSASAI